MAGQGHSLQDLSGAYGIRSPEEENEVMEKRPPKPPIRDNREDRQLPSDLGAEKAILGSILLENSAYLTAINLEAEDFMLDSHRKIYLRMTDLMAAGKPVDFVTLTAELQNNHELENVGGDRKSVV